VNKKGHLSRCSSNDMVVAMNLATLVEDIQSVRSGGYFLYNSDLKFDTVLLRKDVHNIGVPFKSLVKDLGDSIQLRKLLVNMVYVGVVAKLIDIDMSVVRQVVEDFFGHKPAVVDINIQAIEKGYSFASENLKQIHCAIKASPIPNGNKGNILIDGNSAAAMGLVYGGCHFVSWYPITPSTSLVEQFERLASKYRKDDHGKNTFSVVQAEDELSAISMVIGAGWAGARALTATSGPGLSLMAEAAGLSYFAEVPAVIWNVQRGGPSTGLPTRTMQGDLIAARHLSHGDTEHVVLLPSHPGECFTFAQTALDLAEQLQSLVVVLSDLDLGMNLWVTEAFTAPEKPFERGKVLNAKDLEAYIEKHKSFDRYRDSDGDGIPYRTLPGTEHSEASYFTRGTGHAEDSSYSENNEIYAHLQRRLQKKMKTAEKLVPEPILDLGGEASIGFIAYGSSDVAVKEARQLLENKGQSSHYLRLRALPFDDKLESFVVEHERVYVVEQNRDAQLLHLILQKYPRLNDRLRSITHFDGLPLEGEFIVKEVLG
jgi:2-oxoglutarate ferredoxin oxidoreductase subunit alpha